MDWLRVEECVARATERGLLATAHRHRHKAEVRWDSWQGVPLCPVAAPRIFRHVAAATAGGGGDGGGAAVAMAGCESLHAAICTETL